MTADNDRPVTAAVLIIGDEILSGRTQDTNSNHIARFLGALGIDLKEARVVGDVEAEIVAALNALRAVYDFVFTTGGIGPTHDDITADASLVIVDFLIRRGHIAPGDPASDRRAVSNRCDRLQAARGLA